MLDPTIAAIEADIAALRTRLDELHDPRLDGVAGRLFAAQSELRRVTRPAAAVERFRR